MNAKLIEKARAIMRRAIAPSRDAEPHRETRKGITVDDVLSVFPGARVLTAEEVQALKMQQPEDRQGFASAPSNAPQQMRLIEPLKH